MLDIGRRRIQFCYQFEFQLKVVTPEKGTDNQNVLKYNTGARGGDY